MHMFINELSFAAQAENRDDADDLMTNIFRVIEELKPVMGDDPVSTSSKLWKKKLSPGLTVYKWMNTVKKDRKRWFMIAVSKGPHVETLLDEYVAYHECRFEDEDATSSSLAGAACFNGLLSSLQKNARFDKTVLHVKYREDAGEFRNIDIPNAFDSGSASLILKNIRDTMPGITSWSDFWENRRILFPNLVFCECVEKQLKCLNFMQVIKIIKRHLSKMNEYCEKSRFEEITPDYTQMGIDATPESTCTMNQFGHQRIFICPDGDERLFEWHSKLHGQNLRIHFHPPDNDCRDFLIGYIGVHLDTCKYH